MKKSERDELIFRLSKYPAGSESYLNNEEILSLVISYDRLVEALEKIAARSLDAQGFFQMPISTQVDIHIARQALKDVGEV